MSEEELLKKVRFNALMLRIRMILGHYGRGRLSRDEALVMIVEGVDDYSAGRAVTFPCEAYFPTWCLSWRQSHGEPELPRSFTR
jgi:hypothetical protein